MWAAKLVKMGALTVASNQFGECVSLLFLASKGKFSEKREMLRELGERAERRGDSVRAVSTDDCPNNTAEYKELLKTPHHTLDAMHAQRRPNSEANNFGYYYPELCYGVTSAMFDTYQHDEDHIDGKLMDGTMKIKIAGHDLKGTGAAADKLNLEQIKALKKVTFDANTGKKAGGQYYDTWTARKFFRSPEVIARKLRTLSAQMVGKDQRRQDKEGRKKHRSTMCPQVVAALERLALNAPHLYDVGDPYLPAGTRNGAPDFKAARGTSFTETINSLLPVMLRGGNLSLVLAVSIILSAITVYNTDRRRALGLELDFGHHNRQLIERINELSLRVLGKACYDGEHACEKLRPLLPDSGARFIADVDVSEFEPLARLRARVRTRIGKRRASEAATSASAASPR